MASPYARIWVVAPVPGRAARAYLPAGLAPLQEVRGEAALASDEARLSAWLGELAAAHAGANVLLVGSRELLGACAALVVGPAGRALAAETLTLDWPVGEGVPHLIGAGLDWLPPIPAERARFPGGPGAAGAARA
jgi:hypothetical protein